MNTSLHDTPARLQEGKQQHLQRARLPAQLAQPLQLAAVLTHSLSICLHPRCAPWPQDVAMPTASCLRMRSRAALIETRCSQQYPVLDSYGPFPRLAVVTTFQSACRYIVSDELYLHHLQ